MCVWVHGGWYYQRATAAAPATPARAAATRPELNLREEAPDRLVARGLGAVLLVVEVAVVEVEVAVALVLKIQGRSN